MHRSDRLAELIERNRDLLARASEVRAWAQDAMARAEETVLFTMDRASERERVRLQPIAAPERARFPTD